MGAIHRRNNIETDVYPPTSGNAPAKLVTLPVTGERTDLDPSWSPDSKSLAFFAGAGERDQRQLWTVKSDGSGAKKIPVI